MLAAFAADGSPFLGIELIDRFIESGASDIYLTLGAPATARASNGLVPLTDYALEEAHIEALLRALLPPESLEEYRVSHEYNGARVWNNHARIRINAFRQMQHSGLVIRRIVTDIPTPESLGLPEPYTRLVMERRGLVLVVGATGSGKSSSLAAMIGHRNRSEDGHILTIEDPVEFVHAHGRSIVTQRDVGIDTESYEVALKNALRQRPDVIMIGEIRDREAMEHAIAFAETGHLCLATLHAHSATQAIERIISFFPEERHAHMLLTLALNLRAIFGQRLVASISGGRLPAFELMLNQGQVKELIKEGKVKELKAAIEQGGDGMQSFDQYLLKLHREGHITAEVAIAEADTPANVRLIIAQEKLGKQEAKLRMASEF